MNTLGYRKASRLGLVAGLVVLSVAKSGAATATQPADDPENSAAGTIKIHNVGTGEDDNSNEPKVCAFTVVGDNFDEGDSVSWTIVEGPPFKDSPAKTGTQTVDSAGSFSSAVINLPDGHYKVFLSDESVKHKVFKVDCEPIDPEGDPQPTPTPDPTPTPTPDPTPTPTPDPTVGDEGTPQDDGDQNTTGTPVAEETPTVTGTWESDQTALPHTGAAASAGLGATGLLLVGAGFGLRRAARHRS